MASIEKCDGEEKRKYEKVRKRKKKQSLYILEDGGFDLIYVRFYEPSSRYVEDLLQRISKDGREMLKEKQNRLFRFPEKNYGGKYSEINLCFIDISWTMYCMTSVRVDY